MRVFLVALAVALSACGTKGGVLAPTPALLTPRIDLAFDINIPDSDYVKNLQRASPNGVYMAPLDAQRDYNYTAAYGAANVYYGPSAPPQGMYKGVGIVVAPIEIAALAVFPAASWPALRGVPGSEYAWLGRFVYTPTR